MKNIKFWVIAATLFCGFSVMTSCSDDNNTAVVNPDETSMLIRDLLLGKVPRYEMPVHPQDITGKATGTLNEQHINQSVRRVLKLKRQINR